MGLIVSKSSAPMIPPLEDGVYLARCVWIIDMGEQNSEKYPRYVPTIQFGFEVCGESIERGNGAEPRMVFAKCTASIGERSKLGGWLKSWRAKTFTEAELDGFDVASMIGEAAQIHVSVNEGKNRIENIMALPKGMKADAPRMELLLFLIDDPSTHGALDKLTGWTKEAIEKSPSWARRNANSERIDPDTGEVTRATSAPAAAKTPGF